MGEAIRQSTALRPSKLEVLHWPLLCRFRSKVLRFVEDNGSGDRDRTGDIQLGKLRID